MRKNFLNCKGFSLIEILAAIVILSIVLISFSSLLLSNYSSSIRNIDKLTTIQLADTYLNRAGNINLGLSNSATITEVQQAINDSTILPESIELNGKQYEIKYTVKKNTTKNVITQQSEAELGLLSLVVEVRQIDTSIKSSTEGYIHVEKPTP
ncbi:prepilin-type N-terminal cleavage/methylation domain-containing protein [Chryseomicrobium palamuruense]